MHVENRFGEERRGLVVEIL